MKHTPDPSPHQGFGSQIAPKFRTVELERREEIHTWACAWTEGTWKASSAEAAAQTAARRTAAVVAAVSRRCVQLCIAFARGFSPFPRFFPFFSFPERMVYFAGAPRVRAPATVRFEIDGRLRAD